jgi:hypothetical protein
MRMSASGEEEREEGSRGEPGGDDVAIARRLALSGRRVIGFLPVGPPPRAGAGVETSLSPAIARALADFVSGKVAVVGAWRGWGVAGAPHGARPETVQDPWSQADPDPDDQSDPDADADAEPPGDAGQLLTEPGEPRLVRMVPGRAGDAREAAIKLRVALRRHARGLARVLIDLSELAPPGVMPEIAERLDGVVLVVRARHDRWKRVAELTRMIPAARNLGVIVIDARAAGR